MYLNPRTVLILGCVILIMFLLLFRKLFFPFRMVRSKTRVILLIIFIFGLSLRLFYVPHHHLVMWDEYLHLNAAETLMLTGELANCRHGIPEKACYVLNEYTHAPPVYATLHSALFKIFGVDARIGFLTSAIFSSLCILLIFALAYLLSRRGDLSLVAAFMYSVLPINLRFAGTMNIISMSSFFLILTICVFLIYSEKRERPVLLFFMALLLFSINTRVENVLLVPLLIFAHLSFGKQSWKSKTNIMLVVAFLIGVIWIGSQTVSILFEDPARQHNAFVGSASELDPGRTYPVFLQFSIYKFRLPFIVNVETEGASFGLSADLKSRLMTELHYQKQFWLSGAFQSGFLVVFFLLGALALRTERRTFSFLLAFFVLFMFVSLIELCGNIVLNLRRAVIPLIPFCILAAYGAAWLFDVIKSITKLKIIRYIYVGLFVLFLAAHLGNTDIIKEHRGDIFAAIVGAIEYGRTEIPDDCLVLSFYSEPVLSSMKKSAFSLKPPYSGFDYPTDDSCVVFFDTSPVTNAFPNVFSMSLSKIPRTALEFEQVLKRIRSEYTLVPFKTYTYEGVERFEFGFYMVERSK